MIDLIDSLKSKRPEFLQTMAFIGEPVDAQYLESLGGRIGAERVEQLVRPRDSSTRWGEIIGSARRRRPAEIGELFLLEACLTESPRQVALTLPANLSYAVALDNLWRTICDALKEHSDNVGWRQPLTYLRSLRLEERYLRARIRSALALGRHTHEDTIYQLAWCILRQADFDLLQLTTLRGLLHLLENAPESRRKAVFEIEIRLRLHDQTRVRQDLLPAVNLMKRWDPVSIRERRQHSEVWFRIASLHADSTRGKRAFAGRAIALASELYANPETGAVEWMQSVIIRRGCGEMIDGAVVPSFVLGTTAPFRLAAALRDCPAEDRSGLEFIRRLVEDLAQDPFRGSDPLVRRVASQLLSGVGNWESLSVEERSVNLHEALALRQGLPGDVPLHDDFSRLEGALDHFQLSSICGDHSHAEHGIVTLLKLIDVTDSWAVPFVSMARALEQHGITIDDHLSTTLSKLSLTKAAPCRQLLLTGESKAIYALGAQQAEASREVERRYLGGRMGVFGTADYTRILNETYVFKATSRELAELDQLRTDRISQKLQADGKRRFSVSRTWAICDVEPEQHEQLAIDDVISVREFIKGRHLDEVCEGTTDLNYRARVLRDASRFLALIHATEYPLIAPGASAQGALRGDLGRWLQSGLRVGDDQIFLRILDGMSESPLVPKRDAHPGNWIVAADGAIVALDFESKGVRPAGYELAQLLDDVPLLPTDDAGWATRLHLLADYRNELLRQGVACPYSGLLRAFRHSCIARAIRALTEPGGGEALQRHGEGLLVLLNSVCPSEQERDLVETVLSLWRAETSRLRQDRGSTAISRGRRARLSKSIAYQLRHGEDLLMDASGWAYISAVSDQLNRHGLRTSRREIELVALHPDERRFEVVGNRIRALYGHTKAVSVDYDVLDSQVLLFHATSYRTMSDLFQSGTNLSPMARRWIHWSSDPMAALSGEARHGPMVLLSLESKSVDEVLVATEETFLTTHVSPELLQLVSPLHEAFLGLPMR